jgi:hypothetical protein
MPTVPLVDFQQKAFVLEPNTISRWGSSRHVQKAVMEMLLLIRYLPGSFAQVYKS